MSGDGKEFYVSNSKSSQMKSRSQFRLRTLFVLFFCFAVGLTVGIGLPTQEGAVNLYGMENVRWSWYYVLLGTGSTAMVLGLLQHVGRLRKADLQASGSARFGSAISFAIVWRVAMAIAMTACLITIILYQRGRIELPERESFIYMGNVFPDFFWYLCIIVVLTSCVARFGAPSHTPRWMIPVLWVCGTVIGMLVLPHRLLIHYLVYIGIANVERYQALRFQRVGAYSHHQADGFSLYWLSLTTVWCSIIGAAIVVWLLSDKRSWSIRRVMAGTLATVLLGFSLGFSVWYYGWDLPREAPDFVAAGACGTWLDWLGATLTIFLAVVVGGYRLAVDENTSFECELSNRETPPLLHESLWIVLVFVGAFLAYSAEFLRYLEVQSQSGVGFRDIVDYMLTDIDTCIFIAMSLVIVRFAWRLIKHRSQNSSLRIAMLDTRRFYLSCLVLSILVAICVPIFAAYSFVYWLGPWYLR